METPLKGPKPAPETSASKYVRLNIAARKAGNYPSLCDRQSLGQRLLMELW